MKYFTCAFDVPDVPALIRDAIRMKRDPLAFADAGKGKTLGLIFMNPSLRTRLSTQKAAQLLGMQVLSINSVSEGWALDFSDQPMNGTTVEHVKEAAAVMGEYCDILGVRAFPGLSDRDKDDREELMLQWMRHSNKPLISLESATRHPLQSLADMMTIEEEKRTHRPKVVLTWAPHVKPVPQAVANSFAEWMKFANADLTIACPEGMELNPEFTGHAHITHKQCEALDGADFVYVKSWSGWKDYGRLHDGGESWLLNDAKMQRTNRAKIMHCLPVRRDVEVPAALLESSASLIVKQAANRVYAAQAVLKAMLESNYPASKLAAPEKETFASITAA